MTRIEEIGVDVQSHLFVRPLGASEHELAYVWRDASGVRWNSEVRTLHANEPGRWVATDLYKQIITAIHRVYELGSR